MKLIVGLGNPGITYAGSRHNVGFMVVKALAADSKAALKRENKIPAFTTRIKIGNEPVILAMPYTYMNLSGQAVGALVNKYGIESSDLLVIYDDLDLDVGRIRIRPDGSSGGHKGIGSIMDSLKVSEFIRLRIGIGRPPTGMDPADFVLSRFNRQDKKIIEEALERACNCCRTWVLSGITESMNIFNAKENRVND